MKFDELLERFRSYETYRPVSKRDRELAAIRFLFLTRNKLYQADCAELRALKAKTPRAWADKAFLAKEKVFLERWGIDREGFSYPLADPIKSLVDGPGWLSVRVDLRYSRRQILDAFRRDLDKWQKFFEEDQEEREEQMADAAWSEVLSKADQEEFDLWEQDERTADAARSKGLGSGRIIGKDAFYASFLKSVKKSKSGRREDPHVYMDYYKAWDARERGKKYIELDAKAAKEVAYKRVKAAAKIIEKGLPGFPPFPKS